MYYVEAFTQQVVPGYLDADFPDMAREAAYQGVDELYNFLLRIDPEHAVAVLLDRVGNTAFNMYAADNKIMPVEPEAVVYDVKFETNVTALAQKVEDNLGDYFRSRRAQKVFVTLQRVCESLAARAESAQGNYLLFLLCLAYKSYNTLSRVWQDDQLLNNDDNFGANSLAAINSLADLYTQAAQNMVSSEQLHESALELLLLPVMMCYTDVIQRIAYKTYIPVTLSVVQKDLLAATLVSERRPYLGFANMGLMRNFRRDNESKLSTKTVAANVRPKRKPETPLVKEGKVPRTRLGATFRPLSVIPETPENQSRSAYAEASEAKRDLACRYGYIRDATGACVPDPGLTNPVLPSEQTKSSERSRRPSIFDSPPYEPASRVLTTPQTRPPTARPSFTVPTTPQTRPPTARPSFTVPTTPQAVPSTTRPSFTVPTTPLTGSPAVELPSIRRNPTIVSPMPERTRTAQRMAENAATRRVTVSSVLSDLSSQGGTSRRGPYDVERTVSIRTPASSASTQTLPGSIARMPAPNTSASPYGAYPEASVEDLLDQFASE